MDASASGAGAPDVAALQAENERLQRRLDEALSAETAEDVAETPSPGVIGNPAIDGSGTGEPPVVKVSPLDALAEAAKASPDATIVDNLVTISERGITAPVSAQNIESVVGALAVVVQDVIAGKVGAA